MRVPRPVFAKAVPGGEKEWESGIAEATMPFEESPCLVDDMLLTESLADPNIHSIAMPDIDLATVFLQQGDAEGLPVLCLHGNLGSKWWWWPMFEIMPHEFNLIAPDLRGGGDSQFSQGTFNIPSQLRDLHQMVEELDLHQLSLIAHSTSCAVALEYALRYSYKLSSLILVSNPPLDGIATPPEVYRYIQTVMRDQGQAEALLYSLMPELNLDMPVNQECFSRLVEDAMNYSPRAVDGITRSLESWHCRDRVGQLGVPVLLVRGKDDQITPHAVAIDTLLSMPSANNLEVIQKAGHSPFIENPLAFAVRLIEFIVQDPEEHQPS